VQQAFVPIDVIAAGVNDIPPEMFMLWIGGMIFVFVIAPAIAAAMKSDPEPSYRPPNQEKSRPKSAQERAQQKQWEMTAEQKQRRRKVQEARRDRRDREIEHCRRVSDDYLKHQGYGKWVSRQKVLSDYSAWCSKNRVDRLPDERILKLLRSNGWIPTELDGNQGFRGWPHS